MLTITRFIINCYSANIQILKHLSCQLNETIVTVFECGRCVHYLPIGARMLVKSFCLSNDINIALFICLQTMTSIKSFNHLFYIFMTKNTLLNEVYKKKK